LSSELLEFAARIDEADASVRAVCANLPPGVTDTAEAEERLLTPAVRASMRTLNFDVFAFTKATGGRVLYYVGIALFEAHGVLPALGIAPSAIRTWLAKLESSYKDNLYHNATHAADVALSTHFLLTVGGLEALLDPIDVFCLIFSALAHDAGHIGVNNAYCVSSGHPLALAHNDRSVLENHHARIAFAIALAPDCDLFAPLDHSCYRQIRDSVTALILDTDFSRHFEIMGKFRAKQTSEAGFDLESREDRLLLLSICLKCCDIGHTAKPLDKHISWTTRITEESFRQGDEEKRLQLPVSPFCDRDATVLAKSQSGFIEFLAMPLFKAWGEQFDGAAQMVENVTANLTYWKAEAAAMDAAAKED
jgi:3',5'-cyclic-nucleotide phosphodiesterase/cAMP-specific phosphodiesterase 4